MFKIGDLVTRKKYGNDIIFKIDKIENNVIYLKGLDVRLYADTKEDDLILATIPKKKEIVNLFQKFSKFIIRHKTNISFNFLTIFK